MTEKDPAPAGMRDQVRQTASQSWREQASALYLGRAVRTRVKFEVPNLRRDGTVPGQQSVGRFFRNVGVGVLYVVTAVFLVIWIAIQFVATAVIGGTGTDIGGGGITGWRRTITVKGNSPETGAVAAGRALARRRGHLWLVASAHGAAFTQVADGQQEVLWSVNGPGKPVLAIKQAQLRFPDASTIELAWPVGERRAFRQGTSGTRQD